jgi:hypothetical protein
VAPIDKDINGNQVTDDGVIWTATLPNGTNEEGDLSDCDGWTSSSASSTATAALFTLGIEDSCDKSHHLMCIQFH